MSHIDTYSSPTAWTDFDMDWENPNSQQACYVDALLHAVLERSHLGDYDFFAFDGNKRYNTSAAPIAPDELLRYRTLITIHNAILNMIPHFIDMDNPVLLTTGTFEETIDGVDYYIDYSYGSYQNGTKESSKPFNYLTLPAIAEKLGLSEIVSPQAYSRDNSVWLKQSYDILNLMKFTSVQDYSTAIKNLKYRSRYRVKSTYPASDVTYAWTNWGSGGSSATFLATDDGLQISTEVEFGISIFYPTSWKLYGYLRSIRGNSYSDAKVFYPYFENHPGDFFEELSNLFQEGLQSFTFSYGSVVDLLPIPASGTNATNTQGPYDYLIEHDFKFKAEEA